MSKSFASQVLLHKMNDAIEDMIEAHHYLKDGIDEDAIREIVEDWSFREIQETISCNVLYACAPKCLSYWDTLLWVVDYDLV